VDVSNRGSSIEKDRTRCVGVAWVTKHDRFSIPAGVGSRLTPGARYSARHDLRASACRPMLPFRRGHVYLHIRCVQGYIN
jgi:hypothetical protein